MAANSSVSVKKKKLPKAPKFTASKPVWDAYEKKKKEVDAHNKRAESEMARRKKIKAK